MTAVLVVGDVINDVIIRPEGPTALDSDTAAQITAAPGGSGANQAVWLAALGVPVRLAARVGAADGTAHRQQLVAAGVDARLSIDPDRSTGAIAVLVGPGGTRSMFTDRGANAALTDLPPGELLDGMGHLHLSGYTLIEPASRAAALALWRAAGEAGRTRSLDVGSASFLASIGPSVLDWTEGGDLILANLDEGRLVTGAIDRDLVVSRLLQHYPLVVLKLGPEGAVAATLSQRVVGRPAEGPLVDPTGAGDAFSAGFLARWLAGDSLAEACQAAAAAAAQAMATVGGRPLTDSAGAGSAAGRRGRWGRWGRRGLGPAAGRRPGRGRVRLRPVLGAAGGCGRRYRRRPDRDRLQRRERLLRPDLVRRVRPGLCPAGRGRSAVDRAQRRGGRRQPAGAVRPVPPGPAGQRRPRAARRPGPPTRPGAPGRPVARRLRRRSVEPAAGPVTAPGGGFSAVEVIRAKRDGQTLTDDQIRWFLDSYTAGVVAEEQAAALLMAIVWRGLTTGELATWTATMVASGQRLDLSSVGRPTVDKHSTGGVGDKVSLPLVPIVAACGAAVPQLSGRGLGHTGGTLDKMETIAGWQAALAPDQMIAVLQRVGGVICAAGSGLAPADARLYALRDVTATVESIPLIASSIMSKKIAEGTEALVLDVKVGTGAFMSDLGQARRLAETMVGLGAVHGVRTSALITAMDTPLGRAVGNAIEVEESLDVLRGGGPDDLVAVTLALAEEMLALAGLDGADPRPGRGPPGRPGRGDVAGHGRGPRGRSRRPAPPGPRPASGSGAARRLRDPPGRPGRGHRGVAAGRGPGPQGGPRQPDRGDLVPGQAGRVGRGGPSGAGAGRRRPRPRGGRARRLAGRLRHRP